jgi:hypothetical protein
MQHLIQEERSSSFTPKAISEHLISLRCPESTINSMLRCGDNTGYKIWVSCRQTSQHDRIYEGKYHCNMRTCTTCAEKRKRRIRREYLPFLGKLNEKKLGKLYFLTISPQNYTNYKEGLKHIRASLKKFFRRDYIKDRIKGGLYVIETTKRGDSWNIHLHLIYVGRRLDCVTRGVCLDCGQNWMKHDSISKKFYCANRKCNSLNVDIKDKRSKVERLFQESSKRPVRIHATTIDPLMASRVPVKMALNYCLKYISVDKSNFKQPEDMAQYILQTRNQRLINKFGELFNMKTEKLVPICNECGNPLDYEIFRTSLLDPPVSQESLVAFT